ALGIKEKTVKNYLSKIYFKLKVKRKTEAILKAVRLGIV
ncbi:MAG: LuxR C-terminal-related transcriptional regulator, partial [Elusimicrobiota bacterium]|nr:LuxR C-terminal-related transcriptional regulator [Endomicrobiia bacterium]MDW8166799.1 LuxR C-terminal-related transcriptional regulator [Elusimicrobiota bacterium]